MLRLATLAATLVAAPAAAAAGTAVFTSTADTHACLAHDAGALAATDGGLVELDRGGRVRKVWTALDGLGGTRARALHRDGDALVVGTDRGLAFGRLSAGRVAIERTARSKPVRAIAEVGGVLYAGTWGGGLLRVDGRRLVPIAYAGGEARGRDRVTSIAVHRGAVHVGTAGAGIWKLENNKLVPVAGSGALVWSLASRRGKLYAGTVAGLALISGDQLRVLGGVDVRSLAVSGKSLLVGTFGDGAYRYRGRLLRARLPAKARFVQAIGDSCVATRDGVWLRGAGGWIAGGTADAPASNDISAIARDGDRVWAGTFDQGLSVYEGGRWRRFEHPLIDAKVNAIAVAKDAVWVATASGLNAIRGDRVTRMDEASGLPSRHIFAVKALADGRVLVGTSQGGAIVSDRGVTALGRKQGVLVGNVWAVGADADGYIWLGSTKGLYRGKPGGAWERYSLSTGHLRDDWVMALVIDPAPGGRRAWVGTYKGGVVRFSWTADSPGELAATRLGEGWVNPGGLTWSRGTLYASTMEGLLAGDGETAGWRRLRGGPGRDTTATLGAGDHLWVATRRGLIRRSR